jgi:hypothetical protein
MPDVAGGVGHRHPCPSPPSRTYTKRKVSFIKYEKAKTAIVSYDITKQGSSGASRLFEVPAL